MLGNRGSRFDIGRLVKKIYLFIFSFFSNLVVKHLWILECRDNGIDRLGNGQLR